MTIQMTIGQMPSQMVIQMTICEMTVQMAIWLMGGGAGREERGEQEQLGKGGDGHLANAQSNGD